jgi:hypothetical protein
MPMELAYIENNGVLLKGTGNVTGDELVNINNKMYETPQLTAAIAFQLCDFTDVEGFNISSEEIQAVAKQDRKAASINPNMLVALVGEKDLIFGLSRMWEAYVGEASMETRVFRTLEEARDWLASEVGHE